MSSTTELLGTIEDAIAETREAEVVGVYPNGDGYDVWLYSPDTNSVRVSTFEEGVSFSDRWHEPTGHFTQEDDFKTVFENGDPIWNEERGRIA